MTSRLVGFNKNLTSLRKETLDEVVRELQSILGDMQTAITEIQQRQTGTRGVGDDGGSLDGGDCEVLGAKFIRVTQVAAAGSSITITHNLGRVPQGAIFTDSTAFNRAVIRGDQSNNIAPASANEVTLILNGSIGDTHIFILF